MEYIYYKKSYLLNAYLSILYASFILGGIYYGLRLKKKLCNYIEKVCILPSDSILLLCWCITFCLALSCFVWLLVQAGLQHPLLTVLRSSDTHQLAVLRSIVVKTISIPIYHLGLIYFMPLNLIISVLLHKKYLLSFASVLLLFLLGTFTLAKAPIIYVLIFVLIFRMLYTPLYLRSALTFISIIILASVLLFICTKQTHLNIRSIVKTIGSRILYGEILQLPYYYEVFTKNRISLKSLIPPYIVGDQKSAARIIAEYSVEKKYSRLSHHNPEEKIFYARVAGVANTFFTGEAFAWAGYLGVFLSPFMIMTYLIFFIYLFGKVRKTWFTVYLFSFFLYKVFVGVFGGISYFIFSSIHIVMVVFLMLLIFWRYIENKNILGFHKIIERLRIF